MLVNTRGIVFQSFKYSDSSVIAKIYTEQLGLQSFLVSAAHSKKSATKINLLQPLSLVECTVFYKEKKQLQRIKEIKSAHPYRFITEDISKSGILIFLNEMLYKSIREEEKNENLFNYIYNSLLFLDLTPDSCANFHLVFLMKLAGILGFSPHEPTNEGFRFFDLQEGLFVQHEPIHPYFIAADQGKFLLQLQACSFENLFTLNISGAERKFLLAKIIEYYSLHINSLKDIKSHRILEEVMI